ncbi:hypothetical protein MTR67_034662 [Solanum verrucosum]|uniref:Uncharacterized protein n=1 Tax=Solanum verrucosum TaxID=315347 RepID=A0AAF0U8K2_SOLVR|nr:hypothetical protein MTR67_034662 [Solanum verrucosum]
MRRCSHKFHKLNFETVESATWTKLLALGGASPRRGHALSMSNFKLPWQLVWPRVGVLLGDP